ncbi:MAG TPA: hypothetical protein VGJ44_28675 [Kribbellaceae bacterium]|jgi:hypothetical protein
MNGWQRFKQVVNLLNLTTLAGFGVAMIGRAKLSRGPRGLLFATGYKLGFPIAGAFTIGNVLLTKHDRDYFDGSPDLVRHEERHSWQYLCLLGAPFWPLYALCAGWSWLRTGDFASRNLFERMAGLVDGGYDEHPPRSPLTALRTVLRSRRQVL